MSQERIQRANEMQMRAYCEQRAIPYQDFEHMFFDHSIFATREREQEVHLADGLSLRISSLDLQNGFTNVYTMTWDTAHPAVIPSIETRPSGFYLRKVTDHDPSIRLIANLGFFFLADEAAFEPQEKTLNLCIRDGRIKSLPCVDRPILYLQKGTLRARETRAQGTIAIDREILCWVGANSQKESPAASAARLYGSGYCRIEHREADEFGMKRRVLDPATNYTPKTAGIDLIINEDCEGCLRITDIAEGGGSNLFSGRFILQIPHPQAGERYKVGAQVDPLELDGLRLGTITSGVTIGPNVYQFVHRSDEEICADCINHDFSLGSEPPFAAHSRKARMILYQADQKTHLVLFDGAPYTSNFQGVTIQEVYDFLPEVYRRDAWFLDPGHSVRMIGVSAETQERFICGNKHKSRRSKAKPNTRLWNAPNGTRVSSALVLRT
jgi:hypothetical protein